jgi:hypothetical protein
MDPIRLIPLLVSPSLDNKGNYINMNRRKKKKPSQAKMQRSI